MGIDNGIEAVNYFAAALQAAKLGRAPLSKLRAIFTDLEGATICLGYAIEDERNGSFDYLQAVRQGQIPRR